MSLQFAPQWVKPIKPTGTVLSPTSELSSSTTSAPSSKPPPASAAASVPFPALTSSQRSASPSTTAHANPALSYSRATHTPQSPNFPDGSQFPFDTSNGIDDPKLAFRYPREAMLGLWEEDKYTELPIDLVQMLEEGGVLVSREVVKPVGLKERPEAVQKLLSSSVHPAAVNRRQTNPQNAGEQGVNGAPHRRSVAPGTNKDAAGLANGRTAFGGFGRGEGGALGGGAGVKPSAGPSERGGGAVGGEGRIPGVLGGGFGGVNRRAGPRKSAEGGEIAPIDPPRSNAPWRPTRTVSGNFEGVLGFSGPSQAPLNSSQTAPLSNIETTSGPADTWKPESADKETDEDRFGGGGGPGWGSAPKKWRIAAGLAATGEKLLEVAHEDPSSMSVRATPSATPLPERDAAVQDTASISTLEQDSVGMTRGSSGQDSVSSQQREEDLANVQWFYQDPNGQEQGPFAASAMQDWYSHAYFSDDLPVRRSHETSFHALGELKNVTGNSVTPFIAPIKPRRSQPSYLPPPIQAGPGGLAGSQNLDSFRQLNITSPIGEDFGHSPVPPQQAFGFSPDRNGPFSPNHFNGAPSPFQSVTSPIHNQPWGAPAPFGQPNFGIPNMRPPQPPFPGTIGGPMPSSRSDPFGVASHFGGGPSGPWGAPGPAFPPAPQAHSPWNQPPPQQSQPMYDAPRHEPIPDEPSYFLPTEQSSAQADAALEQSFEFVEAPEDYVEETQDEEEQEPEEEPPADSEPEPEAIKSVPPPSVWGQVRRPSVTEDTSPRKSSLPSAPASAQLPPPPSAAATASTASRLPPAPASLPPKPASARSGSISEVVPPKPAPVAEKTSLPPKPAPWAVSEETVKPSTSASLREIQEAEARRAEARKAALAEARAATSSPLTTPSEEVPSNITWGLPSSASGRGLTVTTSTPSTSTPPPPAWGSGDSGPKKTLKQIQEEEERRAKKAASATVAASASLAAATSLKAVPGASPVVKRGYADLAATSAPPGSGWTTVGKTPTVPGAAARPASIPSKPASIPAKPATPAPASVAKPAASTISKTPSPEDTGPSVDFIKWTKGALVGLSGNVDDFVQMLLSFPADPPASQRADIAEIISDSVYGASSTLDGRRFASEFMSRRKADAARATTATPGKAAKGVASLADVVKTVPKPTPAEAGFKVVKAKGKKKN